MPCISKFSFTVNCTILKDVVLEFCEEVSEAATSFDRCSDDKSQATQLTNVISALNPNGNAFPLLCVKLLLMSKINKCGDDWSNDKILRVILGPRSKDVVERELHAVSLIHNDAEALALVRVKGFPLSFFVTASKADVCRLIKTRPVDKIGKYLREWISDNKTNAKKRKLPVVSQEIVGYAESKDGRVVFILEDGSKDELKQVVKIDDGRALERLLIKAKRPVSGDSNVVRELPSSKQIAEVAVVVEDSEEVVEVREPVAKRPKNDVIDLTGVDELCSELEAVKVKIE